MEVAHSVNVDVMRDESGQYRIVTDCVDCLIDVQLLAWTAADDDNARVSVGTVATFAVLTTDEAWVNDFNEPLGGAFARTIVVIADDPERGLVESRRTFFFLVDDAKEVKTTTWEEFACRTPPVRCTTDESGAREIHLNLPLAAEEGDQ